MAGFGSLAPDQDAENDLLSQPQYTYGLPPLQKPAETPPQQGLPPPGWISKAYQEAAPDDWRTREALEGMAGELEANRPSGFRTMWNAIRHPSLAPIIQQVREAQKAQQPPTQEDLAKLPDVGQPLISPGPQISGGTTIGRAIQGPLYEATREALRTGFTDPHEALYGNIPMWDPLTGHTSERMVQAGQNVAALAGGAEGVAGTTEHALNAPGRDVRLLGRPLFREPEAGPQISIRTGTGQVLRSDTGAPGTAISIGEHVGAIPAPSSRLPLDVFHGTRHYFDEFRHTPMSDYPTSDQALGPHFAKDPAISNSFTEDAGHVGGYREGGHVIPARIPDESEMLRIPQMKYANGATQSDGVAIANAAAAEAYKQQPTMLQSWLTRMHGMSPQDVETRANDLLSGRSVPIRPEGKPDTLQGHLNNYGTSSDPNDIE